MSSKIVIGIIALYAMLNLVVFLMNLYGAKLDKDIKNMAKDLSVWEKERLRND